MSTPPPAEPLCRYHAILFDLDGVLADTQQWIISAFEHTAAQHGLPWEEARLHRIFGQPLEIGYQKLYGSSDAQKLAASHRGYQQTTLHLIAAFPDSLHVLKTLRTFGLPLAIITGRRRQSASDTLNRTGLGGFFEFMVCADDDHPHKPDPAPIFYVLDQLGIDPRRALMVGDAAADILCGQQAGCDTAAALYGFTGSGLSALQPTYLLHRLSDLLPIVINAAPPRA